MKRFRQLTYTEKIRWRIRVLWLTILCMLVYMVVVVELGGGDSRVMSRLANVISDLIFFGGLAYILSRIIHNNKLLKNRMLLKEQMRSEQDERNQYLHSKSGGIVLDVLLLCLLLITLTASLFHMAAFYTAVSVLVLAIFLKLGAYWLFSRIS